MFSCTCALTSAHRSEEERPLVVRRFLCVHGHRDSTILPCVSAAATCTHHKWMLKAGFVRPSRHRKHKTTRHPTRKTFADPPANPVIFPQTGNLCANLQEFENRDILFIWDNESSRLPPCPPARPPAAECLSRSASPRRAVVFLQLTRLFYPPDLRDHLCRRING